MIADCELLARYPTKPPKLLMIWLDAQVACDRAGDAFVAAGRLLGTAEDQALCEAERWEEFCYDRIFSPLSAERWRDAHPCMDGLAARRELGTSQR